MAKNLCAKTVTRDQAYEVWESGDGSWTWYVLKKWQADDDKPYARWFCEVVTPYTPDGEFGDTYVSEIKANAVKVVDRVNAGQWPFCSCGSIDSAHHVANCSNHPDRVANALEAR